MQPFVNGSIKERWGSPLIVKPVKTKEGYAAISLCLPTRNQVTQVSVRPRVVSEADDGVSGDFAIFPDAARNAMGDRSDNVSLIPHNPLNQHCGTNAGDVLGAFLRFFVA